MSATRTDPRSAALLADAHALGVGAVRGISCHDLYFLGGALSEEARQRLRDELLVDPLVQTAIWREDLPRECGHVVETRLRPGVTDRVAGELVRAAAVLGIPGLAEAATGRRYVIRGDISAADLDRLVRRLLTNPVVEQWAPGEIDATFPPVAATHAGVETIPLRMLDDTELLDLSARRALALDLAEMQAVQAWFDKEDHEPTDVELETVAQTWSEHCSHKTFRARVDVSGNGEIEPLLDLLRAATEAIHAPWVRSAFIDNAGIVALDDRWDVAVKVETHNHPSAVEPFGGANTGVGGVLRDVLGVSATPIAAMDVLCFGPIDTDPDALPDGVLHPRRIRAGVVAGIGDYGNKVGVPTVAGAVVYHDGFTANPLVFCGCVGLAPAGSHRREPSAGDRVVVLGGRTGRDGLRGATFSSMTMDARTGEVAGAAVQIGDPITEKGLVDVLARARDLGLYTAVTDCGAGGLSSAVGEMAADLGADIDLERVPRKYPGLAAWEVWLSEAQERMVLAVPHVAPLAGVCATYGVELADIGAFTGTGRLVVRRGPDVVADIDMSFLHDGRPPRRLHASLPEPASEGAPVPAGLDAAGVLCALLAHPDIASKAAIVRTYDHEVQGATVVRPLTGVRDDGPSDAAVLAPLLIESGAGLAVGCGVNPRFGMRDAYRMAVSVVDEAIRNVVATGADPDGVALLDNFSWGDPNQPETLGALVHAVRGCCDAARAHAAPFVSGKDSLNNEYLTGDGTRRAVPPTLVITAVARHPAPAGAVTTDLKAAGNLVFLVGAAPPAVAGSHLEAVLGTTLAGDVPAADPDAPRNYRGLHQAIRAGLVQACHDVAEGGIAVAAAEMCIGGRLGLDATISGGDPVVALFGEANGCLLAEVLPADSGAFEACFEAPPRRFGTVTAAPDLRISDTTRTLLSLPVDALAAAWTAET